MASNEELHEESNAINVNSFHAQYRQLAEVFGLGKDTRIVGIFDSGDGITCEIRLASTIKLPNDPGLHYQVTDIRQIGDLYSHPEKYQYSMKGTLRGAPDQTVK